MSIYFVFRVAAMECGGFNSAPKGPQRRKKSAKDRRAQKTRAIARAFQCVAQALGNVANHRGGELRHIGKRWHASISAPHASTLPVPNFHAHVADTMPADPARADLFEFFQKVRRVLRKALTKMKW